ncbi:MAG: SGNH/GDSL hydrolase family protein [Actinomycetota bacterium]
MQVRRRLIVCALVSAMPLVSACSASRATPSEETLAGIGRIPGAAASAGVVTVSGIRAMVPGVEGPVLGANSAGNRLLVVGDSILAGTASRYGGALCSALVPLGWQVAVEAEAGRMVDFGRTVVGERITEGWDATVVFLGTNYGGNEKTYETDLGRIVDSLAPRPTLLLTATLYKPTISQVNRVIRKVAARSPHVSVLDWGSASAQNGVLNRDNVHPTEAGRTLLVASIAAAVGTAPAGAGKCLPSLYTDDSLVTKDDPGSILPATTVTLPAGTPEQGNPRQSTTTVADTAGSVTTAPTATSTVTSSTAPAG